MRGLGYFISIVSVMLLGIVAWPGPEDPAWQAPIVLAGMTLSVAGMGLRYLASRQQKQELHLVERTAGVHQPAE
jgi:hypothetical protein